ncbi:unnamed protein product, partial [marine sediment metagenome]
RHGPATSWPHLRTSTVPKAEGPVWLIFPYDEMTVEERKRYTAWSIWAL